MAYRIFISHGSDVAEVKQPLGKITISKEKSSNDYGGYYWETKMTNFTIQKKLDSVAYQLILNIENGPYRCDPMFVEVRNYTSISNNIYSVAYRGEFSANNCAFNLEKCTITVSSKEKSVYDCIEKIKDYDYNMLRVENIVEAYMYQPVPESSQFGDFQFDIEYTVLLNGVTPTGAGWDVINTGTIEGNAVNIWGRITTITSFIGGVAQEPVLILGGVNSDLPWVLEETITGAESGEDTAKWALENAYLFSWGSSLSISATCNWANAVLVFTDIDAQIPGADGTCYSLGITNATPFLTSIPNGRRMSDVLMGLLGATTDTCGFTISSVVSDFFQINADPSDINYVTGSFNYWKDPLLFQITDVKTPDASEQSSVAIVTFKKLMSDLKKMFNVVWWVETDGTSYWLRIEHLSFAESNSIFDATNQKGYKSYSYNNESLAAKLRFATPVQRNVDFVGTEISFIGSCTNGSLEDVTTDLLCADIAFIQQYPNDTTNDAIVIVANNGVDRIWTTQGAISGASVVNAPMSWANLHAAFYLHGANAQYGYVNNTEITFQSTKRIKKQSIIAKNCNLNIHAYTMIETELGVGEISSISTDIATSVSNIDLLL